MSIVWLLICDDELWALMRGSQQTLETVLPSAGDCMCSGGPARRARSGAGPGDVLVPLGSLAQCMAAGRLRCLPACLSVSVTACLSVCQSGWLVGKHCLSCRLLVLCMLLNIVVSVCMPACRLGVVYSVLSSLIGCSNHVTTGCLPHLHIMSLNHVILQTLRSWEHSKSTSWTSHILHPYFITC